VLQCVYVCVAVCVCALQCVYVCVAVCEYVAVTLCALQCVYVCVAVCEYVAVTLSRKCAISQLFEPEPPRGFSNTNTHTQTATHAHTHFNTHTHTLQRTRLRKLQCNTHTHYNTHTYTAQYNTHTYTATHTLDQWRLMTISSSCSTAVSSADGVCDGTRLNYAVKICGMHRDAYKIMTCVGVKYHRRIEIYSTTHIKHNKFLLERLLCMR